MCRGRADEDTMPSPIPCDQCRPQGGGRWSPGDNGELCLLCARFLVLIVSSNRSPGSCVSKDTYTGYLNCFRKFQSKDDQSQILSRQFVMRYLCINSNLGLCLLAVPETVHISCFIILDCVSVCQGNMQHPDGDT